jgi:hypothetical protein
MTEPYQPPRRDKCRNSGQKSAIANGKGLSGFLRSARNINFRRFLVALPVLEPGLFALRGRKLGVAGTCNQLHNSPQHAHLYVLIRCAFLQRLARNRRIPSTPRILMVVEVRDGEEAESASRDQVPF